MRKSIKRTYRNAFCRFYSDPRKTGTGSLRLVEAILTDSRWLSPWTARTTRSRSGLSARNVAGLWVGRLPCHDCSGAAKDARRSGVAGQAQVMGIDFGRNAADLVGQHPRRAA